MSPQTSTLEILLARFDGAILIPLTGAAAALRWPLQTARNRVSEGTCPFPTSKVAGRRVVHVCDLAAYIDEQTGAPAPAGPRLGASTKVERLAAAKAGFTGPGAVKAHRAALRAAAGQEGGAA